MTSHTASFTVQMAPGAPIDGAADFTSRQTSMPLPSGSRPSSTATVVPVATIAAADQFDPSWDLTGIAQDAQLYFRVGQRRASETTFPNWKEGSEFKATREKSRAGK